MKKRSPSLLAACVCIVLIASPAQQSAAQDNGVDHAFLREHNAERARMGVPALRWSNELAEDAQSWAQYLARRQRLTHASYEQRKGAGENLWMGPAGYFSPSIIFSTFLQEKQLFRDGIFPDVSRTGRWRDVGHYTQVIWRDTREVGCAVAYGRRNEYLVCRYWPAGNVYGHKAL